MLRHRHNGIYHRSTNNSTTGLPTSSHVLTLSLALNVLLTVLLLGAVSFISRPHPLVVPKEDSGVALRATAVPWHGGHPASTKSGSCWCSEDKYCMCTPSLAIDLVIASGKEHLWLVRRKDTGQLATMGGFVKVGEDVETAAKRELYEEMGIKLDSSSSVQPSLVLFGLYSDPRRDNRRHTVSAVYAVQLDGTEQPKPADDVKEVKRISIHDIEKYSYFADHKTILMDYRRRRGADGEAVRPKLESSEGDFAVDIARSVC